MDLVSQHRHYMSIAIREALRASEHEDVPVGALIVYKNSIIGRGHNQTEMLKDSTAHAEILAITSACGHRQSTRLEGCTAYITHEPCAMCAGALLLARVDTVVFGAAEPKFGACGSLIDIPGQAGYNHKMKVLGGIMEEECKVMMQQFFREKRDVTGK